jgi:hypothetical protein
VVVAAVDRVEVIDERAVEVEENGAREHEPDVEGAAKPGRGQALWLCPVGHPRRPFGGCPSR